MDKYDTLQLQDEAIYPDDEVLKSALGQAYKAYVCLLDLFKQNDLKQEWRYYKDGKAWLCKIQQKKKTIVWLSVWNGYFEASIYFPLRLLDDIMALDISPEAKEIILNTKNVGKSKPCTFKIHEQTDLKDFEKVMQLKIVSK